MSVYSTYTAVSTSLDVTRRSRSSRTGANVRRASASLPGTSLQNVVRRFVGSGSISKPTPNHCRTAGSRRQPQQRLSVQAVIVHNPDCRARASLSASSVCKSCCCLPCTVRQSRPDIIVSVRVVIGSAHFRQTICTFVASRVRRRCVS